jgi:hypothetical protein
VNRSLGSCPAFAAPSVISTNRTPRSFRRIHIDEIGLSLDPIFEWSSGRIVGFADKWFRTDFTSNLVLEVGQAQAMSFRRSDEPIEPVPNNNSV